jgi:hypothetical protein
MTKGAGPEGQRVAQEELRKEVNGVMASELGHCFMEMFSQKALPSSYPFPCLDFHDSSARAESPVGPGKDAPRASSSISELLAVLEEAAANTNSPLD